MNKLCDGILRIFGPIGNGRNVDDQDSDALGLLFGVDDVIDEELVEKLNGPVTQKTERGSFKKNKTPSFLMRITQVGRSQKVSDMSQVDVPEFDASDRPDGLSAAGSPIEPKPNARPEPKPLISDSQGNQLASLDDPHKNLQTGKSEESEAKIEVPSKKRNSFYDTAQAIKNARNLVLKGLRIRRKEYPNLANDAATLTPRLIHSYCIPTFSTLPVVSLLAVYLTAFYEQMGVSLAALSFFMALARSLDVTSDPVMSYLTDSCRLFLGKYDWGRRKPFCITGCWFYAFFLMALLSPPDQSVSAMSLWFGAFYILFFLANTYTTIPYDALGPEMTDNYDDRSKLFFVSGLYDGIGALIAITLPQFVAYASDLYVVSAYYGCHQKDCYQEDGVGISCLRGTNSGKSILYDLGFNLTYMPAGVGYWNYTSSSCSRNEDVWYGVQNYCQCLDDCAAMCNVQSQRVAYRFVGFFFGSWFCLAMMNLFYQVKERSEKDETDAADKDQDETSRQLRRCSSDEREDVHKGQEKATIVADNRPSGINSNEAAAEAIYAEGNIEIKIDSSREMKSEGKTPMPDASATEQSGNNASDPVVKNAMKKTNTLVPSLLNTFRNKAFSMLLPAWICDSIGFAILASMTTYFVRYVIKPEYQTEEEHGIDCNEGIPIEGTDSYSWKCKSNYILGLTVTMLLMCAIIGTPFWLFVAKKLGKRKAWLCWSFSMAFTNILFLCVGEGDVTLCVIIGGLNGFPFGAKFLADAILSDIIDYDEFLTGQRNEATYTMFKSFLPKICAVPAAAIPLALMESLGHVAPVNGQIMEQPSAISTYTIIITVIVPFCLSVIGSILKYKFPLKDKQMCDAISCAIGLHKMKKPAKCPVSGRMLALEEFDDKDGNFIGLLDHFPGTTMIETLRNALHGKDGKDGDATETCKKIVQRASYQLYASIFSMAVAFIAVVCSFDLLNNPKLSVVPVLLVILFGMAVTCTGFTYLRLKAAKNIQDVVAERSKEGTTKKQAVDLLDKVKTQRKKLNEIGEWVGKSIRLRDGVKEIFSKLIGMCHEEKQQQEASPI
mmetsp:Transcript_33109/g.41635  ORF Transcript_33109/g.41635 Transcript_33109/m.41635 type:complete len:1060 (-) Transcript_33109:263-3442(-)